MWYIWMTAVPTQSHYYYSESLSVIIWLSWNNSPKQKYVSNLILQEMASIGVLHRKGSIFTFWRQKLHFYSSIVLPLDSSQNHFVGFLFVLEVLSLLLLFLLCTNMDFCCKVVVSSEPFIFMTRNMRQPLQGLYIIVSPQGEDKCWLILMIIIYI